MMVDDLEESQGVEKIDLEELQRSQMTERNTDTNEQEKFGISRREEIDLEKPVEISGDGKVTKENQRLVKVLKHLDKSPREEEAIDDIQNHRKDNKEYYFYKLGYYIPVVHLILDYNQMIRTESNYKANFIWNSKMGNSEQFGLIKAHQKVNHFPNSL